MTIIAFRTARAARKPLTSKLSAGTIIALPGAVLAGLIIAAIGPVTHQDWQAKIGHYAALPAKAASGLEKPVSNAVARPAPSAGGFGF